MGKYAIFLGAGASASCGAPTQNNLLKEYFLNRRRKRFHYENELERELATFFKFIFGIDVDHDDLNRVDFPTFEEALGILDIAVSKNEAFKEFEEGSRTYNQENRVLFCREYLVFLMASILHDKLFHVQNNHRTLINNLETYGLLKDCIFISTNYDLLIDNAITKSTNMHYSPDYGFKFDDFGFLPDKEQIKLFKLHGSLNWLYCPTCNSFTYTGNKKGVIELVRPSNPRRVLCNKCESLLKAIIIPPTYFKQFSNYFISSVWFHAEKELRDVDKIIFCGYSFPDADLHVKYMLKRIETYRERHLDIIVFNNHENKNSEDKKNEEQRYNRFFIKPVNYTDQSFEYFINNVSEYF